MSDVHLQMLRSAAKVRARQLRDDDRQPGETSTAWTQRHRRLEQLASRARDQLSAATVRRKREGG